jgi:putative membrane protein
METPELKLSDVLAQKRTDLAVQRTKMAANRTLMAWIRTSISFIGFGFTIYKFLQSLQEQGVQLMPRQEGPQNIGLLLLALGTGSAILGIIEYWKETRAMQETYEARPQWFPLIIASLLAALGIFLIVSILLK